jgi:NitT/TauT family transport system substrate-binding protein
MLSVSNGRNPDIDAMEPAQYNSRKRGVMAAGLRELGLGPWAVLVRTCAVVLCLVSVACAAPATPPPKPSAATGKLTQMTPIKWASTGVSWTTTPQIIGIEKKFFEAENLSLEMVVAGQSAAACQQVLAKAVELGQCSLNDMIQAVEAGGAPLLDVSTEMVTAINYGMMAKPGIKSWADLKGKIIIVGGPKDNTVYYTRLMARPNGLKDEDYEFQFAGASSARYAALKSGAVDAAVLTDPFDTQAEQDGFTRVDDLRPKYITAENYSGGGVIVAKDWAKDHPNEIAAYIRAFERSVKWLYDPANKEELFAIMQPKLNTTREAFERTYARTVIGDKIWATNPLNVDTAIQGVANSLVELGALTAPAPAASKYYDNSYAELASGTMP